MEEKVSKKHSALGRPGSDLLSQALRLSIIGAGEFNGRVRNGIGFRLSAIATRPTKRGISKKLVVSHCRPSCRMGTNNESDQANRAISTGKLHALLRFHTRPINVVVFHGSQGELVLRRVSHLDAFSGYPVRT